MTETNDSGCVIEKLFVARSFIHLDRVFHRKGWRRTWKNKHTPLLHKIAMRVAVGFYNWTHPISFGDSCGRKYVGIKDLSMHSFHGDLLILGSSLSYIHYDITTLFVVLQNVVTCLMGSWMKRIYCFFCWLKL